MLVENGDNKQLLKNLIIKYNNEKNNNSNQENNTEKRYYKILKKLPWIPNISPKIKRKFKKIGKDIAFMSWKNLPNSPPGAYQLDCSCNEKYIASQKRRYNLHDAQNINKIA